MECTVCLIEHYISAWECDQMFCANVEWFQFMLQAGQDLVSV